MQAGEVERLDSGSRQEGWNRGYAQKVQCVHEKVPRKERRGEEERNMICEGGGERRKRAREKVRGETAGRQGKGSSRQAGRNSTAKRQERRNKKGRYEGKAYRQAGAGKNTERNKEWRKA